jgi:hypothetical protein
MKHIFKSTLMLALLLSSPLSHAIAIAHEKEVIDLEGLKARQAVSRSGEAVADQALQTFDSSVLQGVILKVSAGESIPVAIAVNGDLLSLTGEMKGQLQFKETVYVLFDNGTLFASFDMQDWKELMAEFTTGRISAQVGSTEESPLAVSVDFSVNKR